MFTYADGRPVRPEYLTHRFRQLTRQLDLPPVRLHDLRHGAATLALASHADLKIIQQMLGHSSIVTTADTYTNSRELHQPGENPLASRSNDRRNRVPRIAMRAT
jgi:integrase